MTFDKANRDVPYHDRRGSQFEFSDDRTQLVKTRSCRTVGSNRFDLDFDFTFGFVVWKCNEFEFSLLYCNSNLTNPNYTSVVISALLQRTLSYLRTFYWIAVLSSVSFFSGQIRDLFQYQNRNI